MGNANCNRCECNNCDNEEKNIIDNFEEKNDNNEDIIIKSIVKGEGEL